MMADAIRRLRDGCSDSERSRVIRASGGAGSIYDPPLAAFLVPILVLAIVAAVATWIPSRRVLRVNPTDLLRTT